jgi:hypothetical protein
MDPPQLAISAYRVSHGVEAVPDHPVDPFHSSPYRRLHQAVSNAHTHSAPSFHTALSSTIRAFGGVPPHPCPRNEGADRRCSDAVSRNDSVALSAQFRDSTLQDVASVRLLDRDRYSLPGSVSLPLRQLLERLAQMGQEEILDRTISLGHLQVIVNGDITDNRYMRVPPSLFCIRCTLPIGTSHVGSSVARSRMCG